MIDELDYVAPESPPIVLRGAAATIWNDIENAIENAIEPPPDTVLEGRAGTGKSMGVLGVMVSLARKYPMVPGRVLITRLTRRSITTSSCVTMRKLVAPGDPLLFGPRDDHRESFWYHRWQFALAGVDNIDNLLSSEWDFIVPDECRQFKEDEWEKLGRGGRNYAFYKHDIDGNRVAPGMGVSKIPFFMQIGMTNPWTPKFWILRRAQEGRLRLIHTELDENPAYADVVEETLEDGTVVQRLVRNLEGQAYDRRMRATNTGTRFRRLVLGEWCAAEGMIYEEWNDDLGSKDSNTIRIPRGPDGWITREELVKLDIREFYAGVDFGDAAPGCVLVAGLTGSGKLIVVAEAYKRRADLEWWTAVVKEMNQHYQITLGFCDHNRVDMVRAFNDVVGAQREGPGAVFVNADKGWERGTALARMRIKNRTLQFDIDALVHDPDPLCIEDSIPWQAVDEIPDYIHDRDDDGDETRSSEKRKDRADPKCHDHGCDAFRYLVVGVDQMDPEAKLHKPVSADRKAYLKSLYTIPVIGFEDENSLMEDMAELGDDEADYLQDMADRMFSHRPEDDEDEL